MKKKQIKSKIHKTFQSAETAHKHFINTSITNTTQHGTLQLDAHESINTLSQHKIKSMHQLPPDQFLYNASPPKYSNTYKSALIKNKTEELKTNYQVKYNSTGNSHILFTSTNIKLFENLKNKQKFDLYIKNISDASYLHTNQFVAVGGKELYVFDGDGKELHYVNCNVHYMSFL